VLLVGEVLSPSSTPAKIDAKIARYADAGIPWYWDVRLTHQNDGAIELVRAFALETDPGRLSDNVKPLYRKNYLPVAEWSPKTHPDGISVECPFPIRIPWSELEI
jgi:Uma2 family endonuclease